MPVLRESSEDGVRSLVLNRPEALNAFNDELTTECIGALEEIERANDIGCVVLSGAGDAFSSGGDLDRMEHRLASDVSPMEFLEKMRQGAHTLVERLYHLPVPTIAKVDGPAVGMGCSVALACDLVWASDDSRFGATFKNAGLGPDTGASHVLPKLCGPKVALELLYLGELIPAERAKACNLINRVVGSDRLDSEVEDVARRLANGPTNALVAAKQLVHTNMESGYRSALNSEASFQSVLYTSADHAEAVEAFHDGREPDFGGS